uniref:Reverse transcriptase Ty1/copia-type domain-containing protein n=1 Tax=Tanacetum cinerariifolium TaxID=118510 RepID=A0A699HPH6_TANCI|nr:hypothetical protein [Tanacetum cinerariifolium]
MGLMVRPGLVSFGGFIPSPSIGFMRPFRCHVTILNTLDPLGKFDGKADEGFLVGYSVNSKAFRVSNSRIEIVQETLHINFLENEPNVAGIGPKWLSDTDNLTMSMNYQPVVAGNQHNDNAGIKENLDADDDVADAAFDVKENKNDVHVSVNGSDKTDNKKHNEKAKRDDKGKSHIDSLIRVRDLIPEFKEVSFNSSNRVNAVSAPVNAAGPNSTNSSNSFTTASPSVDAVNDEEEVGAEADLSYLETNIHVSPIPTTRVHKDHPVNQIIGDLNLAPQTRSMTRMVKEQGGLHQINNEYFHTYLPKGKRAIGSKWVFRNKKDERWIVIRNKAKLVAQGHTQEEGIDYDKVFALVARIEAIRLFLAYASFMGFKDPDYPDKVYKVVKALYGLHQAPRAWYETLANYLLENGFQRGKIDQTLFIKKQKGEILLVYVYVDEIIFGSTNKELCKAFKKLMKDKFQMSSMGELTFFLGLQVKQKDDEIFISQDKYVAEILRKFGFTDIKLASTPIKIEKPLLKDPDDEDVDVHIFRSMIGSLMYLTLSRPDIMFTVCACTVVATSSTEAEYVVAASCCTQVLWIQNQLLDYGEELTIPKQTALGKEISNPFMAGSLPKTIWHFITAISYELMLFGLLTVAAVKLMLLDASDGFDEIMDFLNAYTIKYALMVNPTIYVSCIKQFWATATVKKVNDDVQLRALIDGKKVVVSKAIIGRDLYLDDADGVECLPNEEIFKGLARIGYEKPPPKLTFYKAFFSTQWKFLIHTLVQCLSAKRTAWNEFSCSMASAVICPTTGRKFNFSKYIFDSMVRNMDSPSKFLMYQFFLQVVLDNQVDDMTTHNTRYTSPALTQKVFANTRRVRKGFSGVETPLFASMLVQPQHKLKKKLKYPLLLHHHPQQVLLHHLPFRILHLHLMLHLYKINLLHLMFHYHRNNQLVMNP